jgi:hypothetical protein
MSDIYLQITETPTVVTLSAPVVSGALASTVTVANTVTVALDSNSLSALENVTVTVGAAITGTVTVSNFPASQAVTFSAVTISNFPSTQTIAGTVTANAGANVATAFYDGIAKWAMNQGGDGSLPIYVGISSGQTLGGLQDGEGSTFGIDRDFPISGTVGIGSLPSLPAGTAQIGSVTASISGTVPVSGTFWQATQPASLASLPALAAGTAQIGSVTASISNSVVTIYPMQGTSVSNTNFTSVTASTTLVSAVANREVLTVFNETGTLFISPGATCTTVAYQVRLGSGEYWECPQGQQSLQHTAVYLTTGGTARVCQVS